MDLWRIWKVYHQAGLQIDSRFLIGWKFHFQTQEGYNKDLQEDKYAIFSSFDSLTDALKLMTGMISTLTVNKDAIDKALTPEMLATDIAYFLVRKGWGFKNDIISRIHTRSLNIEFRVSFRRAHGLAGQVVAKSEELNIRLDALSASTFSEIDDAFGDGTEIQKLLQSYYDSVEQYSSSGGTSKRSVLQAIEKTKNLINKNWKFFFILKW